MKKIILLLLVLLEVNCANASHMMGGEITWECSGSNYIFTLKVYRDCREIVLGTGIQQLLVDNHPSITTINCAFVSIADLSAPGCGYDCSIANAPGGAVEEYIFKSAPINLGNVTPPANGWIFTWNLCCRNSAIMNLNNPGLLDMTLRSKMFSYNGRPADPCFDNSPAFAERPASFICSGNAYSYSNVAFDAEADSLIYSWDKTAEGSGASLQLLNYKAPYTTTSQLPGFPVMDQYTGKVNLTPDTAMLQQGDFATCIRVDAYKCNVKVAEIYREARVELTNACPPLFGGGGGNHSPQILDVTTNLPFLDYNDTVFAGDTIALSIKFQDLDFNSNPISLQVTTATAKGLEFGINDTGTTGCLYPPCATLNHPSPYTFSPASVFLFNWITGCNHVVSSNVCINNQSVYQFEFKADDNYCPSQGSNTSTVTIVVKGPLITAAGATLSCSFPNGTLQWYLDSVLIPGATGSSLQATTNGIYTVIATLPGGCSISSPAYPHGVSETATVFPEIIYTDIVPNPSNGIFDLRINASLNGHGFIRIANLSGRMIDQHTVYFEKGSNHFPVDLSRHSSGVYELQFYSSGGVSHQKIIID
ncbi:MAG: T9SS type A sorting domain-containing protein [Bacteroidota bacterium]